MPLPPAATPSAGPAELVAIGPQEDVATALQRELAAARTAGQRVVVDIGAAWCAPCRTFHAALAAGELGDALAGVRFVEFDHDAHGVGLRALGYRWELVPTFALPGADGRASGLGFGGVPMALKDAPNAHLTTRLRALLASAPPD